MCFKVYYLCRTGWIFFRKCYCTLSQIEWHNTLIFLTDCIKSLIQSQIYYISVWKTLCLAICCFKPIHFLFFETIAPGEAFPAMCGNNGQTYQKSRFSFKGIFSCGNSKETLTHTVFFHVMDFQRMIFGITENDTRQRKKLRKLFC